MPKISLAGRTKSKTKPAALDHMTDSTGHRVQRLYEHLKSMEPRPIREWRRGARTGATKFALPGPPGRVRSYAPLIRGQRMVGRGDYASNRHREHRPDAGSRPCREQRTVGDGLVPSRSQAEWLCPARATTRVAPTGSC